MLLHVYISSSKRCNIFVAVNDNTTMIRRMMIRQNQSPEDLLTAGSTDNKCFGVYVSNIQYNSAARYVQTCRRSIGSDLHERRGCAAKNEIVRKEYADI